MPFRPSRKPACAGIPGVCKLPRRRKTTEASLTRRALITGITGQDGSYLAEHLADLGYEVWGLVRGQANPRVQQLRQLVGDVRLVRGDLLDQGSLITAVERVQPDEVYNLAAISYVPMSWQQAELTGEVTGLGVLRMLEAIRVFSGISASRSPGGGQIRFYQASSSEMFGQVSESPQNEKTSFHPRSPYGVAKVYGHLLTQNYRESYGMFAVSGILFNHESPRRGAEFLPAEGLAGRRQDQARLRAAAAARQPALQPGLGLRRRLRAGHAADAGAGRARRLRDRDRRDAHRAGAGRDARSGPPGLDWRDHVVTDAAFIRPAEVDQLRADRPGPGSELGWEPKIGFEELVAMMVDADLELLAATNGNAGDIFGSDTW